MPWIWPRHQPMLLPCFVSRQAGRLFPSLPSTDELRRIDQHNRIRTITQWIYDVLKARRIAYERDEIITPGPSTTQRIRTPWEMRAYSQGTCLDLALLFCGVCATYELLTTILLFEDHVIVAVCNTHDRADPQQHQRKLYSLLAPNKTSELYNDRSKFLEEVMRDHYLAIECTGFAADNSLPAPEGHKREAGQLSFEAALLAGRNQLQLGSNDRRSFYAIDVEIAWNVWGMTPARNQLEGPAPQLHLVPPLRTKSIGNDVEFVGRREELIELLNFLKERPDRPIDFHWALWTSMGGQGKTRLAWQFCREAQELGWNAGFLASDDFNVWSEWQVTWPTLVVIDQIGFRPEKVSNAVRALSQTPNGIIAPLRLLLLERRFKETDPWVEQFAPVYSDSSQYLFDTAYHNGTNLAEIARPLLSLQHSEIWGIISTILDRLEKPLPDRELTLSRLQELDPAMRPLFAILVAEAIAEHGSENWRLWNREQLVRWVLSRDFSAWKNLLLQRATVGDINHKHFEEHLNAVIISTIVGAQTAKQLARYRQEFGVPLPERISPHSISTMAAYTEMNDPNDRNDTVPGLSPDILGELFVLERLAGAFGSDSNRQVPFEHTKRILDVALAVDRFATLDFIIRTIRDFGEHSSIQSFGEIDLPEGDDGSYPLLHDHAVQISHILQKVDRPDLAERLYTRLIERSRKLKLRQDDSIFSLELDHLLAVSLYNRGMIRGKQKNLSAANADLNEAITILAPHAKNVIPPGITGRKLLKVWSMALRARAFNEWTTEDLFGAVESINQQLAHPEISASERVEGMWLLGRFKEETESLDSALMVYEAIRRMDGMGLEEVQQLALSRQIKVLLFRANEHQEVGEFERAYHCLSETIALAASDPESNATAYVNRGVLLMRFRPQYPLRSLSDFETVLNSPNAPLEQQHKARLGRSQIAMLMQNFTLATKDVESILVATDLSKEVWAMALLARAQIRHFQNRSSDALADVNTILEEPSVNTDLRNAAVHLIMRIRSS